MWAFLIDEDMGYEVVRIVRLKQDPTTIPGAISEGDFDGCFDPERLESLIEEELGVIYIGSGNIVTNCPVYINSKIGYTYFGWRLV
jgi:hypothetical protein